MNDPRNRSCQAGRIGSPTHHTLRDPMLVGKGEHSFDGRAGVDDVELAAEVPRQRGRLVQPIPAAPVVASSGDVHNEEITPGSLGHPCPVPDEVLGKVGAGDADEETT